MKDPSAWSWSASQISQKRRVTTPYLALLGRLRIVSILTVVLLSRSTGRLPSSFGLFSLCFLIFCFLLFISRHLSDRFREVFTRLFGLLEQGSEMETRFAGICHTFAFFLACFFVAALDSAAF